MVFEAVVVKEPTDRERAKGQMETILAGPILVVAKDKDQAKLMAMAKAKVPEEEVSRVNVLVRGF